MSVIIPTEIQNAQGVAQTFPRNSAVRDENLYAASITALDSVDQNNPNRTTSIFLPEILGIGSSGSSGYGGRSFLAVLVDAQKALSQMAFDTKIVNREQSVTYGKGKAQTLDDQAKETRRSAIVEFGTQIGGAVVNMGANAGSLLYAYKSSTKTKPGSSDVKLDANKLDQPKVGGGQVEAAKTPEFQNTNTQKAAETQTAETPGASDSGASDSGAPNPGVGKVGAGGDNPKKSPNGDGDSGRKLSVDAAVDGTPDAMYVSPIMNAVGQIGAGASTIISGTGGIIKSEHEAHSQQLGADGQLFDTYAGEQGQFYSDAGQNSQRALSLISSLVGQIYNTNTSIIGSMPR